MHVLQSLQSTVACLPCRTSKYSLSLLTFTTLPFPVETLGMIYQLPRPQ